MKKIRESDLVYIHPTLFEDQKIGIVWKVEERKYKHVIDPRVPELTKEKLEKFYSVWVFGWNRSADFLYRELSLIEVD
tara:strand:+ start:350 stop:583 length:234 start_codon:yes stop_codon:yes gene_type:complete